MDDFNSSCTNDKLLSSNGWSRHLDHYQCASDAQPHTAVRPSTNLIITLHRHLRVGCRHLAVVPRRMPS